MTLLANPEVNLAAALVSEPELLDAVRLSAELFQIPACWHAIQAAQATRSSLPQIQLTWLQDQQAPVDLDDLLALHNLAPLRVKVDDVCSLERQVRSGAA